MSRFLFIYFLFTSIVMFSQQSEVVDFEYIQADIEFDDDRQVLGRIKAQFKVLKEVDSVYLDAVNMRFENLRISALNRVLRAGSDYYISSNKLVLLYPFQALSDYVLEFSYTARPKQALYFIDDQVWTQGQGKYTSHWLPSIDDMNEKIEFDLSVSYHSDYTVLANGLLIGKTPVDKDRIKWHFDMKAPMSSYLVALAIGQYDKKTEQSDSGIPLEYYYYPEDSTRVAPTYRYSKQIFDFLEKEIGVPYPWEIYRQVPVRDFLYSGMENTSLTIFSDALVIDEIAFNDQNYINVNAHELAHQWFGNLVTATSGTHHWLQEGFATYYALLAEREVFGEAHFYWQLHDYAQQLLAQENAGKSTSLLDPKSSSVTFYQKGAWALHVLREQVGTAAFRLAVKTYLENYQYGNVETSNFIGMVETVSGQNLSAFVKTWLQDQVLPQDAMVESLAKSDVIREFQKVSCETYPLKCASYLGSDISDRAKIKILLDGAYEVKLEDFENGLKVRQAITQKLTTIPLHLKTAYESLLKDRSYVTIEYALYNLWVNFPTERARYLGQTKAVYGFNDYNVRLLWLALNLNTIEYQSDLKPAVYEELKSYIAPQYGFERRINAFNYLKLIDGFDKGSLKELIHAKKHHNWRFQQFAKQLLNELEDSENYGPIIEELKKENTIHNR